ncbi:amidase [Caldinitratiruptor microaerophilus]|uniref:Amidase n=1 Tax=Caldinitratiruptor microaerophilus TaxID=671077 RepID=A0AA35CIL7_9FIRM|nr:amidase [Caldinitratiruptor microaerophilus]BDG59139.1 amidase [Caldinitratiruptor microaerophilus]
MDPETVRRMAEAADLPLTPEEREAVARTLGAWLEALERAAEGVDLFDEEPVLAPAPLGPGGAPPPAAGNGRDGSPPPGGGSGPDGLRALAGEDELAFMPISELAPLLRGRQVSPVEVTEAVLARIEALEPQLNAHITVLADAARESARAAEAEILRGNYRGPLHGVPIGLKDLYDVAGVPTTAGTRALDGYVPRQDATAVRRLREAGAVLVGKHNLHEIAFGATGANPHYGPSRNPWDRERHTGGSSSGTAAAVAAGMCHAGLGSDTGGSIRIPAALTGLVGLKPTYGRVSRRGVIPLAWSLDHAGPLSRTVADAALVLAAIAGHDPDDPTSIAAPVPDYAAALDRDVRGLRIGVPEEYYFEYVQPDVRAAVLAAVQVLEELGAVRVPVSLPTTAVVPAIHTPIIAAEAASWHARRLREEPGGYGPEVRTRLQAGALLPAAAYVLAQRLRSRLRREYAAVLARVDVVATPAVPVPAPRLGESEVQVEGRTLEVRSALVRLTSPLDHTGLPAVTVPCGQAKGGLPVGLQFFGRPLDEVTVLRAAAAYESARGPWARPPL